MDVSDAVLELLRNNNLGDSQGNVLRHDNSIKTGDYSPLTVERWKQFVAKASRGRKWFFREYAFWLSQEPGLDSTLRVLLLELCRKYSSLASRQELDRKP